MSGLVSSVEIEKFTVLPAGPSHPITREICFLEEAPEVTFSVSDANVLTPLCAPVAQLDRAADFEYEVPKPHPTINTN